MFSAVKRFDVTLTQELPLLLLLLLLVALRLPNFLEPYWYGDEGIYLTIGVALRQGAHLYADIVDHKTPLIYYLAMVPSQFWFRALNLVWMSITTIAFYHVALKLLGKLVPTVIAATVFVLLTSVPWFEGHIPNGELFVMGFAILGGLALLDTKYFSTFLEKKTTLENSPFTQPFQHKLENYLLHTRDISLYIAAGCLFGLAILTKVPALFDFFAFMSIAWFRLAHIFFTEHKASAWFNKTLTTLRRSLVIASSTALTISVSIVYFVIRGTGQAYLDFGLLYNFRYVQSWQLTFANPLFSWLFSMQGKVASLALLVVVLTIGYKVFKPSFQFIATWLGLTLFAALLSNRPYPHYFLQVMPALSLIVGLAAHDFFQYFGKKQANPTEATTQASAIVISLVLIISFLQTLLLLDVGLYKTWDYYQKSLAYMTGQLSQEMYYQSFDSRMSDNYRAAAIISQTDDQHLFIWGDNPMLYALARKSPVGRFTVAFHIEDFGAYDETLAAFKATQPRFAVVMKDQDTPLPGLEEYLAENYLLNANFHHFELWKRQ